MHFGHHLLFKFISSQSNLIIMFIIYFIINSVRLACCRLTDVEEIEENQNHNSTDGEKNSQMRGLEDKLYFVRGGKRH